jgi:D-alanyl-D-alanine dipeptidase
MANGVVVMERHDNLAVGQGAPDNVWELSAKQQQVVEVNHIRPEIAQQLRYVGDNTIEVDLAHEEVIEMSGPQKDLISSRTDALKARARSGFAMDLVGGAEKQGFMPRALIGAKQVMGGQAI